MKRIALFLLFFPILGLLTGTLKSQIVVPAGGCQLETFDDSTHNWTFGAIAGVSSWEWAAPMKAKITDDITGGEECIILGGNTDTSTYNPGENSWAMTPEYDLSAVDNPYLEFWFYWANEDGTSFDELWMEYSVDGGLTWLILSPPASAGNCYDQNWYNYTDNWGGADTLDCFGGGTGPDDWLLVRKCVQELANEPSVYMRFRINSGSFCQHFGATIDNFSVCDAVFEAVADFSCTGNPGEVAFTDSSYNCADEWNWDFGDGNTSTAQNPVHTYAAGGSYTVTLISGASLAVTSGCGGPFFDTLVFTVDVIDAPIAVSPISCNGASDGSATVSPTIGAGPYTYSWSPAPPVGAGTNSISSLGPGTWTVTVSGTSGCPIENSFSLTNPSSVTIDSVTQTNLSCYGSCNGTATVSVAGGTAPLSVSWNTVPVQTGLTATSLCPGPWTATVTDSNGCTASTVFNITEPPFLQLDSASQTDAACTGICTGEASVNITGGTGPFSISWSTIPPQTGNTATGLCEGPVTATVTDDNGCTATASFTIGLLDSLVLTTGSTPSSCGSSDGSAFVNVTGGTPGYTYAWNTSPPQSVDSAIGLPAGSYQVVVTDLNGCADSAIVGVSDLGAPTVVIDSFWNLSCNGDNSGAAFASASGGTGGLTLGWNSSPPQTGTSATGLPAGSITVTVTDGVGCSSTATTTLTEPSAISLSIDSILHVSCNGGSNGEITASGLGGTAPLSFTWNSVPPQSGITATGLSAGSYQVIVSDSNGCMDSVSGTVTEPSPLVLTGDSSASTCGNPNGELSVAVSGGTPGYSFLWDDPSSQTNDTASGLPAGTYTVIVSDSNGCTGSLSLTVEASSNPVVSLDSTINVSCNGDSTGSAFASVTGGLPGYSISWSSVPPQTGPSATGLPAGSYMLSVSDSNGCTDTTFFDISEPAPLVIDSLTNTASNCGSSDGIATVFASGGEPPFTYLWGDGQATMTATGLSGGLIGVTITDDNGCSLNANTTIVTLGGPSISIASFEDISCFGSDDGWATAIGSGGSAPFTYLWNTSPPQAGDSASGLSPGDYTVIITDSTGCEDSATVTISEPEALVMNGMSTDETCIGDCDGSLDAEAAGGTSPYTWLWNNGATGSSLSDLCAGTFIVTVTDNNGCQDSLVMVISPGLEVTAGFTSVPATGSTLTLPDANVEITNTSTNAIDYFWEFGDGTSSSLTDPLHSFTSAGNFCIQLISADPGGCADTTEACYTVEDAPLVEVHTPNTFTPNGDNVNDVFFIEGLSQFENPRLQVFNRWGNKVYDNESYNNDWTGVNGNTGIPLPDGAYFYILTPGQDLTGKEWENMVGDVVIMR